jgi:hypothetical protein
MLTILSLLFAANVATTSSIHATVRGTDEPLEVSLLRRDGDSWSEIVQRPLPASERTIAFDRLAAGVYQIRVQRAGGGAPAVAKVIVGAGEKRHAEIEVDPIEIFGRVSLGDLPLPGAVVVLSHREFQWSVALVADEKGLFHGVLWQRGLLSTSVRSSALATPYHDRIDIEGRLPFRWDLRLPERRIAGIVRDRVTGAGVAGATLHFESKSGDSKSHFNTRTGADGRFDLAAMHPGLVTIEASHDGYLDGSPVSFELAEADRMHEVAIALDPGAVVPIAVSDSAWRPLAHATVLTVIDGNVRARATTGADGRARVTLPRDTAATLYAIPHDGSFAVVHVAKAEEAPRRVAVPRPSSTLRIVTRTTDGKPLANVDLLMRANGALIPPAIADELLELQGLTLHTDDRGEALLRNLPSGSYEFWPYSGESEGEAIVETAGSLVAPIVVDVKTGENTIAVNFRAR